MAEYGDINDAEEEEPLTFNRENNVYVLYKRRWLMMLLFMIFCASNLMQYPMYTITTDIIARFYYISPSSVTWTTTIFLLGYVIFSVPINYLQIKLGMQISVFIGAALNCLAAWIKAFSVHPSRFWLVLVGQVVVGGANVFVMTLIPQLPAVWFGPDEVGKACSIGMFGVAVGTGIGYVLPPLLVTGNGNLDSIRREIEKMVLGMALSLSVILLLILFFFEEEPPSPPSRAQLEVKQQRRQINASQSLKRILTNRSFMMFIIVYGITLGIPILTFATLLNPILLKHFPDSKIDAGIIGLLIIISGTVGSLVSGYLMDKYKLYREMAMFTCIISLASIVVFTFTISINLPMAYITLTCIGCTGIAFMTIAYEVGVELTFPEPENISGNVLVLPTQIFGIVFMYVYSYLFYNVEEIYANLFATVVSAFGIGIMSMIPIDLKRTAAQKRMPNKIED